MNLLDLQEETGIDYAVDTFDGGLHLNVYGAEKLSGWFGQYLTDRCGLTSRRGEEALEKEWAEIGTRYDAEIARQLDNIAVYGNVRGEHASDGTVE